MSGIRVDFISNSIIVTQAFLDAAAVVGTEEYNELRDVRKENPNMKIVRRSVRGNKESHKSKGLTFDVQDDNTIIPPFITIDGLGETVAKNIESEAKKHPFISIEDFQTRCKVSQTLIDKMRAMGIFNSMPESSQLSLFDF